MSLKSWKKEFYPITAKRCSKKNALAHSLLKWRGLQKSNLKRHSINLINCYLVYDGNNFEIGKNSCVLCGFYYGVKECPKCPLEKIDDSVCSQSGAWGDWLEEDPKPMIALIRKAMK